MNLRFLAITLFFSTIITLNLSAQGGQLDSDYFMIGAKRIFTNMQGQTSPSNESLTPNLKENAAAAKKQARKDAQWEVGAKDTSKGDAKAGATAAKAADKAEARAQAAA